MLINIITPATIVLKLGCMKKELMAKDGYRTK